MPADHAPNGRSNPIDAVCVCAPLQQRAVAFVDRTLPGYAGAHVERFHAALIGQRRASDA